eukprot:252685-Pyramimonas_sp.AAC.1
MPKTQRTDLNARLPGLEFANNWLNKRRRWTAVTGRRMEAPGFGGNRRVPIKNFENPWNILRALGTVAP